MLCTKVLMFLFMQNLNCFRPLSRWIGSYTNLDEFAKAIGRDVFPSPREVDRFLYVLQSIRKLLEEAVSVPSRGG